MDNNEPSSSSVSNTTKGDESSEVVDRNETDSGNTGNELLSGGYSYELVDSLVKEMKELECPICCLLMRDAQELGCHHAMCLSCLNKWEKENIEKKGSFTCPQCCVEIAKEKTVPSGIINRLITTSIKVKCDNSVKGCEWIGVICDIVLHMKNKCDFTIVKCLNGRCTEKVQRKVMDAHVEGCLYRIINCCFCSCEVTFVDQNDHLNGCEMALVQCGNKGCLVTLPRNQITSHEQECNFKPIKCWFESIGCTIELPRKDMEEHLIHSTNYHMNLMLVEMKTGKTELENVRKENDQHRKQLEQNLELKATKSELKETKVELKNVRMENDQHRKLLEQNLELKATITELKETKAELKNVRMENDQCGKLLEQNLELKATITELKETNAALENVKIKNDQQSKLLENIFMNDIVFLRIKNSQYFQDMERSVIAIEKEFIAVNHVVKDRIRKFVLELKLNDEIELEIVNNSNTTSINSHNNKIQKLVYNLRYQIIVLNEVRDIFRKYSVPFTAAKKKIVEERTSYYYKTFTERLNKCIISDWKETNYSERIAALMEHIPENSMLMNDVTAFLKLHYSEIDSSWELIITNSEFFNPSACWMDLDDDTVEIELPRFFYSAGVCNLFQNVFHPLEFKKKTKNEQIFTFNDIEQMPLCLSNGFILIQFFDGKWNN